METKTTPKKRSLGTPPTDLRDNLKEPEIAPTGHVVTHKVDKRTLRRAGRDYQLNAGVSLEFRNRFNEVAARDHLQNWELIMAGTALYERLTKEEREAIIEEIRRKNPPAYRILSR
ncbi:hypothetical protein [Methylomagnum ishizawai]|uniref:hypothetical protein n=1 Tax=Methylomagnum ishizawai TaxID=1760988 RepID=UPI001C333B21|nr:hypothetical protein [Methylomagnum ishizawai]BBL77479.1 hypothetical protein MishRS11D_45770 [Methylomagnum ishizawai]